MFVGAKTSGLIVSWYPPHKVMAVVLVEETGERKASPQPLPDWAATGQSDSLWRYLDLSSVIRPFLFPDSAEKITPPDFAQQTDANKDGQVQKSELPEAWIEQKEMSDSKKDVTYPRDSLAGLFDKTTGIDTDGDESITRVEWRVAQAHDWQKIWIWPALMAGVTCLLFWLGFHDRVNHRQNG